ncbi:MAG: SUMF1/EgtB/PvdO family nonheme iron enzyme [Planctomycetaceae bacterium]|nr:SUMF1/EgtB/PvdO family nonheme iron enzyme [Planctomycetaceae bacterium]
MAFGKDTITIENDGKPIRVTPGTHSLAVSYDGIHFDVEESFEVTKNDEVRLRIERVGDQIIVHQGGSETAPLPNRVPLRPPVIESVELVHTLASDEKQVWDLAFSPDGKSLAAANNGGSVKVFDSSTGNLIHTLSDFDCPVFCVTYSHDGKILATGDSHRSTSGKQRSGTATLWSTNDWSKLSAVTDTKAVRSLAFTPDSNRLILGLGSSMPEDMLGRMEESQARMAERAGSGRGASGNMTFKMWQWGGLMIYDVPTNKAVPAPAVDSSRIVAVTPTNDGQKFASCGFRGELKLRDLENGVATLDLVEPPGSQYAVHDVAIAPNADVLAAGAPNGFLLYDVSEEKEILRNTTAGEVLSLSFSDDGRILATGHSGHPIQLWDTSTGKQLASIPVDWKVTTDLEFQPGGHLLAASSESDGTARIWDVQSSLSDRSLLSSNSTAQTISAADKASSAMDPVPSVDRADRPHFSDSEAPSLLVAPFSANEATQFQQNWAEYLGIPVRVRNSIGLEFVLIPPGEFLMGSPPDEEGRSELPRDFYHTHGDKGKGNPLPSGDQEQQHRVVISKPFYLATTELTQGQYEAVVGGSSRSIRAGKTSEHPVGMMGYRAQEFVGILNRRPEELPAIREYRLPTEAEWEFACRAGTETVFHFGDSPDRIQEFDWVVSNSNGQPHPVGEKTPNPFGLFDLHGNLREWCADVYAIYPDARVVDPFVKKDDPLVTGTGGAQVVRGGSYKTPATKSRSAWRFRSNTRTLYTEGFGVRLAASIQSDRALPVVPKRDDVSRTAPPEPSELKELRARTTALAGKPAADRDVITLREELTAFRLKHYGTPWAVEAAKLMTELRWPVDELTRGAIDPYELKVAGSGDIENVPRGLVHIMGDSRLKHWAHVEYLDFSPDGQTIVSASRDRSVVIWYTQSGRQKQILTGLPSNPRCARFSPDGESVAICCGMKEDASDAGTKEIVIWDLKQDKIDKKLTGGHTKPIRRVNWSGDGKKVVSWAYDNLVNIWDVRTGKVLKKIETEGTGGGMVPVCWKTNTLVVPFQSQRYQLWNLEYLKPHDRPEIQHEALQSVRCISNDGSLIAFMSEKDGKTILIWDVNTGKPVQTIKQSEGIIEARFTPDNKFLLIGDYGSYVKLWDLQSGKLATSPKEPYRENNASDMTAVAISANGAVYAHAGSAGKIAVRDFRTHELLLNPAKENTYGGGKLASAKMSYDGTLLATQGWGGCIDTWDPIMAKYNLRIFRSTLTPRAIDVSPDGAIVGYPRQWSSSPMLFLDAHKTENAKPYMKNFYGNECAFSPDGQHVAVATQEDKDRVFIHNYQSGKTITTISHPGGTAERMRYTPDGKYLVTNTYQGTSPVVYNPVTAERLPGFSGHKGIVQYFNFSPDGKCLISASSGARELKVWDFESRKVIQELIPASIREKTTGLTSPAYSPDGRWIMVTVGINSGAGYLLLWDAQTLELKHRCHYRTDSGILKGIRNVFFTLDGRHVIRADYNGTIKYFRISEMEKVDAIPEGTKT